MLCMLIYRREGYALPSSFHVGNDTLKVAHNIHYSYVSGTNTCQSLMGATELVSLCPDHVCLIVAPPTQ